MNKGITVFGQQIPDLSLIVHLPVWGLLSQMVRFAAVQLH